MDYKITDVQFSIKDESIAVTGVRTLTLVALISFEYIGVGPGKQYGTATYEFGKVGSATIDENGFYTAFTPEDVSSLTVDSMMTQIEELVEDTITSINVKATTDSYAKSILNHFRTLKNDNGEGFPSMYQEGQPRYSELDEWKTGIGQVGMNVLEL